MSAETKQVLEMLKEGKINTEDAEKLLEKLSGGPTAAQSQAPASGTGAGEQPGAKSAATPGKPRFLRIQVQRPGRENVNMRVPLSLAKAGIGWVALIPPRVNERLAEQGIDLSGLADLKGEDIREALENMHIDVDREDGRRVRIFCE
jgi:SHOCT-like protein